MTLFIVCVYLYLQREKDRCSQYKSSAMQVHNRPCLTVYDMYRFECRYITCPVESCFYQAFFHLHASVLRSTAHSFVIFELTHTTLNIYVPRFRRVSSDETKMQPDKLEVRDRVRLDENYLLVFPTEITFSCEKFNKISSEKRNNQNENVQAR